MHRLIRVTLALCVAACLAGTAAAAPAQQAQEPASFPFQGEVNADGANVRIDSTVGSQSICTMARAEPVDVVGAQYDWYRIRLPKNAPAYIKKNMVSPIDDRTVRVLKSNVNVRMGPGEDTAILGKTNTDEVLTLAGSSGEWFQVQPPSTTYGWINKRLVHPFRTGLVPKKTPPPPKPAPAPVAQEPLAKDEIATTGIIEPYGKVINREATHKLTNTAEGMIFLLKGDRKSMDSINYRKVKVTGKLTEPPTPRRNPVIEVKKIELLD